MGTPGRWKIEVSKGMFLLDAEAAGMQSKLTNTEVTNTDTGDETTHHHVNPRVHRGDLDDISDDEQEDTESQALAATPPVGSVGAGQSTQEGADAHEGDEDGRAGGGDGVAGCCAGVFDSEAAQEVFEDEHAADLTLLRD